MKSYLAVDIGASSGRHILGRLDQGVLVTEEIYRFKNGLAKKDGHLVWDVDGLFADIVAGLKACGELDEPPVSMGVDTWGVDFVLLDKDGNRLGDAVGYRDGRTEGMDAVVAELIGEDKLYAETGIQKQIFNTIYQLTALRLNNPEILARADKLLLMPDYFHYLLCGVAATEYTNATTTQLVNPQTADWHWDLIAALGLPRHIFLPLKTPGTELGDLRPELAAEVGFTTKIVLPPTHDTAAAILSVPVQGEDTIYLSSGTWSLIGTEQPRAICTEASRHHNFTNEGGYAYRYRHLKNIMGLWMIQQVRAEMNEVYDFAELCRQAEQEAARLTLIDVDDPRFLAPDSMIGMIKTVAAENGGSVPETVGQLAGTVYQSLAASYRQAVGQIEEVTGKSYKTISIVGGGSSADYLNRLTARFTGKKVIAGPTEATAIGNLAAQMIAAGEFADFREARQVIADSSELVIYD